MPGAFDTGSLPGGLAADSGKSSQPGAATPDAQRNGQPGQESAPTDLLPAVTLPKGGGAIRGLGEKLSVDAATGATSMTLPLPLSPGRSGFTPALALRYDSTASNGPFGFGWSIGLPADHPQDRQGTAASTGTARNRTSSSWRAARTWYPCSTRPAAG